MILPLKEKEIIIVFYEELSIFILANCLWFKHMYTLPIFQQPFHTALFIICSCVCTVITALVHIFRLI